MMESNPALKELTGLIHECWELESKRPKFNIIRDKIGDILEQFLESRKDGEEFSEY